MFLFGALVTMYCELHCFETPFFHILDLDIIHSADKKTFKVMNKSINYYFIILKLPKIKHRKPSPHFGYHGNLLL